MAVNGDDERESDGRFGGGDGDGENRDHDADWLLRCRTEAPERDKIQIRCRQHQLNADQNKNGMTSAERGEQSDAEERGGDDEEELQCWGHRAANRIGERTRLACWGSRPRDRELSLLRLKELSGEAPERACEGA